MYRVMVAARTFGKMLLLPPRMSEELVTVYRKAAEQMVNSPEFHSESEKMEPGARYLVGEKLARSYLDGISARPETVEFIKKYVSFYHVFQNIKISINSIYF
jgi:tripartite-type tricarboxylate transporter receptor subunit TctC